MGNLVTIEAEQRTETGKTFARRLRRQGKIPANLLGGVKGSTLLQLDYKLLSKAWKSSEKQFNLSLAGNLKNVRIQELQFDPVKRLPLHVDLMLVES